MELDKIELEPNGSSLDVKRSQREIDNIVLSKGNKNPHFYSLHKL